MKPSEDAFQPPPPERASEDERITPTPPPAEEDRRLPGADRLSGLELALSEPTDEEVAAFVGPNVDYYLARWAGLRQGDGGAGFNWAAFLVSGIWLPFRKMYAMTMIFYALLFAETILEEGYFQLVLQQEEAPGRFGTLVGLAVSVLVGAMANRWYWSHARRVILQVRTLDLPEWEHVEELRRRGGTNLLAGFALFGSYIALMFVAEVVVAVLREGL